MLPTHKHTTPSGGYCPTHFSYFLMQESIHEWGGGVEGLGKGHRGGHLPLGGGGCTTPQGGMGEVGLWFG